MKPQQGTPQSFLVELLGCAFGIVAFCALMLLGYWAIMAIQNAWPISLYTIVASILLIVFCKRQNPFAKALVSMLKPIVLGLAAVFVLALWLNSASAPSAERLRQFEEWVLVTSNHFPSWSKLPIIAAIGVYLALSLASIYVPRLRLIHRLGVAQRYLGLIGGALVVMASFTFFSAHAFQDRVDNIVTRLTAQFRDSKRREANEVAQYLAYEAVERAVRDITPEERQFYAVFLDVLSAYDPGTAHLRDRQVGRGIFGAATASSESEGNSSNSDTIDNHRRLDVQLERERRRKAVHDQKLADAQDGLKKAVSEMIGLGTDMLREHAFHLFESLGLAMQPDLAKEVQTYLGKVSDDALESKLEPHVNRFTTMLSNKINQFAQRSVAPNFQREAVEVALMEACVTAATLDIEAAKWTSDEGAKKLNEAREMLNMAKEVRAGVVGSALPENIKSRLSVIDSAVEGATLHRSMTRRGVESLRQARERRFEHEARPEPGLRR